MKIIETPAIQAFLKSETIPPDLKPLNSKSSDKEIDECIRRFASIWFHPMEKVVDTDLRVISIERLRVVNASVLPVPIAAHLQACIFALGSGYDSWPRIGP